MRRFIATAALFLALGAGGTAFSATPKTPEELKQVYILANELENSLRYVESYAEMSSLGRGWSGDLSRARVSRFLRQARLFRMKAANDIEKRGEAPSNNEFQRLLSAYDSASRGAFWLDFYGSASVDMAHVDDLMRSLRDLYRD